VRSSQDIPEADPAVAEALAAGEVLMPPGHRVGRYTVRHLLGVGGMSCVYLADDPELSRVVALKVLRNKPGLMDEDSARRRLVREGQAMARLSHENVVRVFGVDSEGEMVFIAMEYVQGVTLRKWLKQKKRRWSEVLDLLLQAGEGLAAAHAEGIIHRDFKPGNVLVASDGRARVMDFGLARGQDSPSGMVAPPSGVTSTDFLASQPITKAGAVVGTPAYMAPEQHFGRTADAKSDQFAFCVTLYEGLFGRRPFPEDRGFRRLARAKDRGEVIKPPRGRKVPRWLTSAVMRGLSARKVDRWPSVRDLLTALRKRRRRQPMLMAAAGLTAFAVTAAVGLIVTGDDPCDAGASLDEYWGQAQREQLGVALAGSENAEPTAERVSRSIDAWTSDWRASYQTACEADDHEVSSRVRHCLERQKATLAATVETLTEPAGDLVDHAVQIAGSLPAPESCARGRGSKVAEVPEALRARVAAVEERLARAEVLEVAGRFDAGLAIAEDAVTDAESIDHAPLLGRALRIQGNLLERSGRRERAALILERAYVTAIAVSDDAEAARAARRLVNVHADGLYDPGAATRWLDELRSRVARLSDEPEADVWLAQAEGTVGMANSDYAAAADAFARGLERFDALPDTNPVRRGALLHNLGIAYYKAGRLEQARTTLASAIECEEETLGALHPSVATSLMGLAGVHYAEGNHDAAMLVAERALDLQRRTLGTEHPEVAASLTNVAGLLVSMGRHEEAKKALEESARIWESVEVADEVSAFTTGNLAQLLLAVGEVERAEKVARRALRQKIALFGEQHDEIANARVLLGTVLLARGAADGARQELEQALRVLEQTLGPNHPRLVGVLMSLAETQHDSDPAVAQAAYMRAASVAESNERWVEAGDAHFALARMLGTSKVREARKQAKAAAAAYERGAGDSAPQLDKVRAWLADLG